MTAKTALIVVTGIFLFVLVFVSGLYLGRRQQVSSALSVQASPAPSESSIQAPLAAPRPASVQTSIAPQTSTADDVRKAVIQATPEIAASQNGTLYDVSRLRPEVEVSLTSATQAKCVLTTYLAPTATLTVQFSVNLTKYDSGWKVDDYKEIST